MTAEAVDTPMLIDMYASMAEFQCLCRADFCALQASPAERGIEMRIGPCIVLYAEEAQHIWHEQRPERALLSFWDSYEAVYDNLIRMEKGIAAVSDAGMDPFRLAYEWNRAVTHYRSFSLIERIGIG